MKRFKRLTTLIVALSMIFSLVQMPMSVNAAMGTGVTEKAKLKLVLLTPDELQTTGSAGLAKPNPNATGTYGFTVDDIANADFNAGDTIYIGIQAEGLKNIAEYKDNGLGVSQISTGITYNKDYVTPYGGNIGRNATYLRKSFEDTNDFTIKYYFYHLDADNNIYYDFSNTTLIEAESTIKYQTTWSGTNTNQSTTYVPNDNDLLYIMLFTLNSVPPDGTKLFDFKDDTESHTLNYGIETDSNKKNYQLLTGTSITQPANPADSTDIRNVLEFDASGADIYPQKHTVTYNANGGSFKANDDSTPFDNTESVAEGSKTTLKNKDSVEISSMLIPPTDKMFEGWYTEATGGTEVDADNPLTVTEDTTLYAHYIDGYKVNFYLNATDATYAGGGNDLKYIPLAQGESPAANAIADTVGGDPIRSGYTFKGWYTKKNGAFDQKYTDDGAAGTTAITAITGQTDLYAMWDNGGTGTYQLTFDSNRATGATGTDADPNVIGYNNNTDTLTSVIGGLPTEPTTSQADYKFIGWYKNQAGDGDKLAAGTELLGYTGATAASPNTTVYAKWGYVNDPDPANPDDPNPNTNTVTITFPKDGDGTYNGGTSDNGTLNDRYIKYGETVPNLPTAMTLSGKGFGGWYTEPQNDDGTIPTTAKKVEATTAIDNTFGVDATNGGTVSLYAYWINKVTVSYDMNGSPVGTAPDSATLVPGEDFTPAAATGFDGTDYKFKEWNTEKNGSGTSYTPGTEATVPNEDTILYAIWNYDETKADAVSVTFDGNDTTQFPATLTPNNGTSDTNKYTIVRQANTTITSDHMPAATRSTAGTDDKKYTLNHWDTTKTAAAGAQSPITVTAAEGTKAMNVYAIWTVTNDADKATVTFKKTNDAPDTYATVVIAKGDVVGPQMPANPTRTDGYNFSKWLKGSDEFKADTQVDGDTDVVGDWTQEIQLSYDKNGMPDAVTVPETVKGAPNDKKTVGNITANGAAVQLLKWNTEPDGSGTSYQPDAELTLGNENITLYAIWNSTDPNAKTITFHANDSDTYKAKLNGVEQKTVTMKRATGQKITAAQMPKAEREKYTLDHWGATALEAAGTTTADITVGSEDIDRYAIWKVADGETSHDVTFNLHDGATPTTVGPIAVVDGDSLGDRMPADPTRDKYTFEKWTTGTGKTAFSSTDTINGDKTVDANWSIKVDVKFTKSEYDYDGTQHTPITTGNYVVFPKGQTSGALTGLTLSTDKYLKVTGKTTDNPPVYTTAELTNDEGVVVDGVLVPKNGGEYKFGTLTLTEAGGDGFTEYEINTIPATFKIKAKPVELTIDKNYQYIGSGESISDITVTSADTNVKTTLTGGDIKVTFKDKDNNETVGTMPSTFGHYTIKIESANDNYSFTVKDNFAATGDAIPMYLINLQRQVKVDYMEGTNKKTGSDADLYATVTLAKPTTLNDTSSAKTTLAGQTTALDVPQSGTDFDPPTGKRIKKFVTGTKSGNTINDQADFDKNTVISFSETNEPLTIYAIYENADWTLTFSDTKTNPAAETFDAYTVDAEKSVKDGLSKKGSTAVTDPAQKTLPVPTAAPANQMFKGWTTDENIAKEANLTSADFETVDGTDGKYKGKLFTDDKVPTAAELGDDNAITVYAVYVKSSDATLKSALFKEVLVPKDADGKPTGAADEVKNELKYVDDLINPTDKNKTFDPNAAKNLIIVNNGFDKLLADLEPTQPGASVAVKVNGTPVNNETGTIPAGHTQAKTPIVPTTYDEGTGKNSTNTIEAIVTAPDGTQKTYTFEVLEYAKPTVVLNPGNSPYGMIERMSKKYKGDAGWTDEHITKAKEKFVDASNGNPAMRFRFKDVNITLDDGSVVPAKPDDVETNITYWSFAWDTNEKAGKTITDEKLNMDMSDTAIFVYTGEDYIDSGFTAYDSLGKKVDSTLVTRTVSVDKMTGHDVDLMDKATSFTLTDKTGTAEGNRLVDLKNIYVKPDVYQMEYTFTDPVTGQALQGDDIIKRPIITLWELGDTDLSYSFNPTDATYLTQRLKNFVNPLNKLNNGVIGEERVTGQTRCIYTFRIADADNAGSLNSTDPSFIKQAQKKFVTKIKFYQPVKVINN